MITVSLCMIVKNEEKKLGKCLESLKDLADEMVIADTGSTDDTVRIAESYGARVFHYEWKNDFADARNFIFGKASCDYIYSADADEEIDSENRRRFLFLKESMDPRVDIVQMYYCNQLSARSVYNYDRELRPKLYRRQRTFWWQDPIHEQVRLEPVVFDSDIEIIHKPDGDHTGRDLAGFRRAVSDGYPISARLHMLYARELFMAGTEDDFKMAVPFFRQSALDDARSVEEIRQACCVIAHAARTAGDTDTLMKYSLKEISCGPSSEMCCELGEYYQGKEDYAEATLWYYNAAYEAESILDLHRSGDIPLKGLCDCYAAMGNAEQAKAYAQAVADWQSVNIRENKES